jgi:hypothetical protein
MVSLSFEQRQFVNLCLARARTFERQRQVNELEAMREAVARERAEMLAEMAAAKAEMPSSWP